MHVTIIAAALLLGAGNGEPTTLNEVGAVTGQAAAAPDAFYEATARPYAPAVTIYYPAPSYDCYSHGHAGIECYPSFRERNYRRPYNYRVKFDYPWHEDLYRSWPDACLAEEAAPQFALEARKLYSGPRRIALDGNRDAQCDNASVRTLGDAPLPPRTLR